jgi:hypothetical protein
MPLTAVYASVVAEFRAIISSTRDCPPPPLNPYYPTPAYGLTQRPRETRRGSHEDQTHRNPTD